MFFIKGLGNSGFISSVSNTSTGVELFQTEKNSIDFTKFELTSSFMPYQQISNFFVWYCHVNEKENLKR